MSDRLKTKITNLFETNDGVYLTEIDSVVYRCFYPDKDNRVYLIKVAEQYYLNMWNSYKLMISERIRQLK